MGSGKKEKADRYRDPSVNQLDRTNEKKGGMPMEETGNRSEMIIPDEAIERLARVMLPRMQNFFESEEGKKFLEAIDHAAVKAAPPAQAMAA